jgi:NAD-dependent deacetylase
MIKQKIIFLTGAGMSAESGVKTFRDADGLWEGHDVMTVATPEGWAANQALVLDFYNQRRRQLKEVEPNEGHQLIAELEKSYKVHVITQNVDNLHERAGSSAVLHLHGELTKVRSVANPGYILDWTEDLTENDKDSNGHQLRPHIVWFGEDVPNLAYAVDLMNQTDIVVIIGTSMQVYPAANLVHYAPIQAHVYYIDPKPVRIYDLANPLTVIEKGASEGMRQLLEILKR